MLVTDYNRADALRRGPVQEKEACMAGSSGAGSNDEHVSVLWPPGRTARPGAGLGLPAATRADLDLDEIVQALCGGEGRRERFVNAILADLVTDAAVINYRQDVMDDLRPDEVLCRRLRDVQPGLASLGLERGHTVREQWSVLQIARRLAYLELYVQVALELRAALEAADLRSAGLIGVRDHLRRLAATVEFQSLQQELPDMRRQLDQAGSITVGINLSRDLTPESATIMSISAQKLEGRGTFLERLLGGDPEGRGLTPLRVADVNIYAPENRVFRDLRKLIEVVARPVGQALERYGGLHAGVLEALEQELSFLLHAVALLQRLAGAGLPVCRPEVVPLEERVSVLDDAYNPSLALRALNAAKNAREAAAAIVTNPMTFAGESARIWILTGPNRGGKTTYTRAIGLAHVLFQAGLPVPARAARLSPVDAIHTHFPSPEGAQLGMGRLDEEADRLAAIFQAATPHSLILLNEVLAGTSAIEALGLAIDAVRGLRLLGARAIYATHLHELAARTAEINVDTEGFSAVGSLVAGVEGADAVVATGHRRTYTIRPGPPRGVSYASEIAEQHGISFPQLQALLRKRFGDRAGG
jgi:DNA mismatch repair protein MutS